MKYLFIYIVLFFVASQLSAQKKHINFEKISLESGLSQSTVNCILQDSKGFMWFGTLDGLNLYDGYDMKIYRNNLYDANSLPDNTITTLFEDKFGLIWIGTLGRGITVFDRFQNRFISLHNTLNNKYLASNSITDITQDGLGNIWVATSNGLTRIERRFIHLEFTHFFQKNNLPSNKINKLVSDNLGNIWIATDNGLAFYNVELKEMKTFENELIRNKKINAIVFDKNDLLWLGTDNGLLQFFKSSKIAKVFESESVTNVNNTKVNTLFCDREGIVWIGTVNNGLFRYNSKIKELNNYLHDAADSKSLSVNNILSIYQDYAGIIWVGTALGGINKWNKLSDEIEIYKHNIYDANSLSSNLVRTIYQDKSGTVWIGTVDEGLNKWDKANGKFIHYKHNPNDANSLSHNSVRAIYQDSKNRFWIGTDGGGLNLFDPQKGTFKHFIKNEYNTNSLNNNSIWGIYEDGEDLLIATFGGGINIFNYEKNTFKVLKNDSSDLNTLSDNRVTCIFKDTKSNFWIGTYGGGLNLYIPQTQTFHRFMHYHENSNTIGNDRIYCIYQDTNQDLWIGTKGSLNKFDSHTRTFTRFTENNGLPNDVVIGILEDDKKNLWFSTNKGICKFNLNDYSTKNYNVIDGLQSNEFLVGAYCKSSTGEMFFGGINGFNAFIPENLKPNENIPKIALTGFKILNQDFTLDSAVSEKKHIVVNWRSNNLTFEFVALDYTFPQKNEYAYMLQGFENEWNYVKNRRFASYTNLPSGQYILRVKGSNNDGIWNENGIKIAISIQPAIWQRTSFQVFILIFIIFLISLFIKIRLKTLRIKKYELDLLINKRANEITKQKQKINEYFQILGFQRQEINNSLIFAKQLNLNANFIFANNKKTLKDYFIFSKPKKEISNDFYWIRRKENKILFAVSDCFTNFDNKLIIYKIASSFLNNYIQRQPFENPGKMLDNLAKNLQSAVKSLQMDNSNLNETRFQAAICIVDLDNYQIEFSSAHMPLYQVRNKKLSIIEGNSNPITIRNETVLHFFENQKINILNGDNYFLFSDGFAKQIGGEHYNNFMYKRFRDLLVEISGLPSENQLNTLNKTLDAWRKDNQLTDDVLVLGFLI